MKPSLDAAAGLRSRIPSPSGAVVLYHILTRLFEKNSPDYQEKTAVGGYRR